METERTECWQKFGNTRILKKKLFGNTRITRFGWRFLLEKVTKWIVWVVWVERNSEDVALDRLMDSKNLTNPCMVNGVNEDLNYHRIQSQLSIIDVR